MTCLTDWLLEHTERSVLLLFVIVQSQCAGPTWRDMPALQLHVSQPYHYDQTYAWRLSIVYCAKLLHPTWLLQSRPVGNLSCRWINTYSMGLWELQACMYSGDIHIQYRYLRSTHSCNSQRRRLWLDQCFPTVLASGLPTNGCLDPVQYQPPRTYINIFVCVWGRGLSHSQSHSLLLLCLWCWGVLSQKSLTT